MHVCLCCQGRPVGEQLAQRGWQTSREDTAHTLQREQGNHGAVGEGGRPSSGKRSGVCRGARRRVVRTGRARYGRDPAVAVSEAEEGGGRGTLALVGDLATSAAASVASMTREALMGRPGGYRAGAAPVPAAPLSVTLAALQDAASAG